MRLYHFTAERFLPGIRHEGLTRGVLLVRMEPTVILRPGYQWLTTNPAFEQEWAKGTGRLPYQRNEVRITVDVPPKRLGDLMPWTRARFMVPEVADMLSEFGDPENWWLYHGVVSPQWITDVVLRDLAARSPGGEGTGKRD
jgi:hypothetical protein